jgi:two-component system phosphate regulon sensor histidine kinase PhoR
MNLINNAIKFSASDDLITLSVKEYENLLYFSVKDCGAGISQEDLLRLGQYGTTINNQNMNPDGHGVGLYSSKMILKEIGPSEELYITSEVGEGSEFSFVVFANLENEKEQIKNQFK